MVTKRKIPYGVINWAKLVRECLFVDNTSYIRKLEEVDTPVFLRPKRFGKSIVCSMLAHYYDVSLKDRFDELFGRTDIGRNPTPLHNSFLVLQFDFSLVQVGTLSEIEDRFAVHVREGVGSFTVRYAELADWSRFHAAKTAAEMVNAVKSVIRDNHLPPLYVIIDEYDNFTNELVVSNRDAEYNAVCGHDSKGDATRESFFKAFFKSFKAGLADGTVGRTYFTGVLPITLDDLSSGFNVGTVVSLNPELMNLVGFTQAQVERYVDAMLHVHTGDRRVKIRCRPGVVQCGRDPKSRDAVTEDVGVLVVESRFAERSIYLYVVCPDWVLASPAQMAVYAERAAQAYCDRWQIETSFFVMKQEFALEKARVRTFKRLENIFSLCVLAYVYATQYLRRTKGFRRILKFIADNLGIVSSKTHALLAGIRALVKEARIRFISGRPRKRTVDDRQMALPGF